MPSLRTTPWERPEDLIELGECFYLDGSIRADTELLQHGCDLTDAYARRAPLPHALAATAGLARAVVAERSLGGGGGGGGVDSGDREMRTMQPLLHASTAAHAVAALYATAFAAFVTGYLDNQQTGAAKRSMWEAAAAIGMPPSFVARRHAIVHEGYAGLRELRRVVRDALAWLWEHYWRGIIPGAHRSQRRQEGSEDSEAEEEEAAEIDRDAEDATANQALADQIALWAAQKPDMDAHQLAQPQLPPGGLSASTVATAMVHAKGQRSLRRHCVVVVENLLQEEAILASFVGMKGEKHHIAKWDPLLRCLATQIRGKFTPALVSGLFTRLLRPTADKGLQKQQSKVAKKQKPPSAAHTQIDEDQASIILAWMRHLFNHPAWGRIMRAETALSELARWSLENPGPYATIVAVTLARSHLWTATRRYALHGKTSSRGYGTGAPSMVEALHNFVEELTQERAAASLGSSGNDDGDDEDDDENMQMQGDTVLPPFDAVSNGSDGMDIEH